MRPPAPAAAGPRAPELKGDTDKYDKASLFSFSLGRWHRKCTADETKPIADTFSIDGEYNACESLFSRAAQGPVVI